MEYCEGYDGYGEEGERWEEQVWGVALKGMVMMFITVKSILFSLHVAPTHLRNAGVGDVKGTRQRIATHKRLGVQ